MMKKRFVFPILALFAYLLVACLLVPKNPIVQPNQPPTEAPIATGDPLATSTPAVQEGYYVTQQAYSQATIEARATASPFPSAMPVKITAGQPASAVGQREGLQLTIRLPKDRYLAGEGGQAEVEIRNEGPETVFVGIGHDLAALTLLDAQGREPEAWPFSFRSRSAGPPYLRKLTAGDVLTQAFSFQVPPLDQSPPSLLNLWTETRFSRLSPDHPEGPDNLWMHLEAGPLKLQIQPPEKAQTLLVDWQADRSRWRLQVKDTQGKVPTGPYWGELGIVSPNAMCAALLPAESNATGEWSGAWDGNLNLEGVQVITQGWIATPGYVTAVFSQTLPGKGDARNMLGLPASDPKRESFITLEEAQSSLDFPIAALAPHVPDSTMETVQVEKQTGDQVTWTTAVQYVRLSGGGWMVLAQMSSSANNGNAGWGLARYDWEARQVLLSETTGYALQQFGWWYLDWKTGKIGFELRAPAASYSLEDLLKLARQLRY